MGKIDISKAKWELSPSEEYFIKWLEDHGFEGRLDKQFNSTTHFTLTRDGVTDKQIFPCGLKGFDFKAFCEGSFTQYWNLLVEATNRGMK